MLFDEDIKIAGERPSKSISDNTAADTYSFTNQKAVENAKKIGNAVAQKFLQDTGVIDEENLNNAELLLQRRILLSFTATVAFEAYIKDDALAGVAQKSFLDTLKNVSDEVYRSSSDMGAFSFYYLAYRRGDDTERRIGQTFAMLCAHDGDPIFQELGEALYCWFLSVVKKIVSDNEI